MKKIALTLLILGGAVFFTGNAHADTSENIAVMVCDATQSTFTVRFGRRFNDEPIEQVELIETSDEVMRDWHQNQHSSDCLLSNGLKVSIRTTEGQVRSHGFGGADPDAYIYLDVNDKHIYYGHTFYAGYGSEQYVVGALMYRSGMLFECTARNKEKPGTEAPPQCMDVSSRLDGAALTQREIAKLEEDVARAELASALPGSCSEMRRRITSLPKRDITDTPIGHLSEYQVDIDNDGNLDRVLRLGASVSNCVGCGNNYFDGSFLMVFPKDSQSIDRFIKFLGEQNGGRFDLEEIPNLRELREYGGQFFSGGLAKSSIRYVYNVPFVDAGVTYVYSFEANTQKIPPAVISKLGSGNNVQVVCKFATSDESKSYE